MPNWKKLIVSGSDAYLSNLNVDNAVTASYFKGDGSALTNVQTEIVETATVVDTFTSQTSIQTTHNFGTKNVLVSVYDDQDQQIIPATVSTPDSNSVAVTFDVSTSGRVVVAKGGHIVQGVGTASDSNTLNGESGSYYLNYNNFTNTPSGALAGRISDLENFSSSLDDTYATDIQLQQLIDVTGSYATTGSNTFVGNQTISGSVFISGSRFEAKVGWPTVGTQWHLFEPADFTLNLASGNRNYTYNAIGLEHYEDSPSVYHNSILFHLWDSDQFNFGSEFNFSPINTFMRIWPSGSGGNLANVSVTDLQDGTSRANIYGDNVHLGAYKGSTILLGNTGSYINVKATNILVESDITASGHIIPSATDTYDLGTPTAQWRDLYLSSGSLYIDGTKVISSDANVLTVTTDTGQSLKLLETGADDITFQTDTGNIELKGTVEILSGKKIIDSAGTIIQFGDNIGVSGSVEATSFIGTLAGTSSISEYALDAGHAAAADEAINSDTLDYLDSTQFLRSDQSGTLTGDLTVTGTVTAQEFHTEYVSASIVYQSGSTKFGDTLDDSHDFTGSVNVTGSVTATNFSGIFDGAISQSAQIASDISGSFTSVSQSIATDISNIVDGTTTVTSASYALTASYALNVPVTASYALTASYIDPSYISASAAADGFGQGGVTSIIAGTGISINQGTGDVTVTALATSGSNGQSVIAPFAYAYIDSQASGTGIGVTYGAYQSGTGEIDVTFGTAQANTNYAVVTDNASFDDIYLGISGKSTTGFTLQLYDTNGNPASPAAYPVTFLVYGENPIATVGVAATGSLVSTGSLSSNTLTFTKGDGTTFDIDLNPLSASLSASIAVNANAIFENQTDILALQGDSGSFSTRIAAQETFSSSLDTTILSLSGSFSGSFYGDGSNLSGVTSYTDADTLTYINTLGVLSGSKQIASDISGSFTSISQSIAQDIANISTDFADITNKPTLISSSLQFNTLTTPFTGSFTGSFYGDGSNLSGVTSYTDADTEAFIGIYTGSYSGSFIGDGSGLTNLPALNTVSSSFAATSSLVVEHNLETKNISVAVYNSSDIQIIPEQVTLLDNQRVKLDFAGNTAGYVVINKGGHTVLASGSIPFANIIALPSIVSSSAQIASDISGSFTAVAATKLNISDTGSFAKYNQNNTFTGTQTFSNIDVSGTASFGYIQSVTGSATYIGEEFIVVNASVDGARFAGIQVYDSESMLQHTASLAWDSLKNKWVYSNPSGGYHGGGLLSGPRNTGSLGEETYPTYNYILRGQGGDHVYDSNIIDNDTAVKIGIDTEVTGTLDVSSTISANILDVSQATASNALITNLDGTSADIATITATDITVTSIDAIDITGSSTLFGSTYADTHQLTGSFSVHHSLGTTTGSLTYTGGQLVVQGDDADFNLDITTGSAIANLTEFRFRVDGGTMGRMYMHKYSKHMYLGPENYATASLFLRDGAGTSMTLTGSKVGIGTTTPTQALEVLGSVLVDGGTGDPKIYFDNTSNYLAYNSDDSYWKADGVHYFEGASAFKGAWLADGKFGVGTTTPAVKLHVEVDSASEVDVARFRTTNGADNHFLDISVDNTNNLVAYDSSGATGGAHVFRRGGSEVMRLDTSSRVAIGDQQASELFNISGGNIKLFSGQNVSDQYRYIGTEYSNGNGNNKAEIRFAIDGADTKTRIQFHTANGAGNIDERVRITSTGRMGINETDPQYTLDLDGTAYFQSARVKFIGGESYNENIRMYPGTNDYSGLIIGAVSGDTGTGVGQWTLVRYPTATYSNKFSIRHNSTDAMIINTSGNVGIGTDPSYKLHVNGSFLVQGAYNNALIHDGADDNNWFSQLKPDGTEVGRLGWDGFSSTTAYYTQFAIATRGTGDSGLVNRMLIDSSGANTAFVNTDVGIGTTDPVEKLHVVGNLRVGAGGSNDNIQVYSANSTSGYGAIRFYQDSSNNQTIHAFSTAWQGGNVYGSSGAINITGDNGVTFGGWNDPDVVFVTGGTNYFKSRVGIGTNSPTHNLHIYSTITGNGAGGTMLLDRPDNASYENAINWGTAGVKKWFLGTDNDSTENFHLYNWARGQFEITVESASGEVGIGTQSPGYKLHVNGSFGATSITETSALRFKENIVPLESQLENINKLNPVTFDWKEDGNHDIGFIAEEVEQVLPDLVSYVDDEVQGLHYTKFTAVLVKAIQEQQAQIQALKEEINKLKK